MTSSLTWLDVSAEQQRRVRDLIRLFEEPGTRDELGIGPIRDAFSEMMFPGTAVIQTRARYLLFIPWHFQEQNNADCEVSSCFYESTGTRDSSSSGTSKLASSTA